MNNLTKFKLVRDSDSQLVGESQQASAEDAAREILQYYFILHEIREISLKQVQITKLDANTYRVVCEGQKFTLYSQDSDSDD